MTAAGVLGVLLLLALVAVPGVTLAAVVRGGRGPGDPPASHLRVDPNGFPAQRPRVPTRRRVPTGRRAPTGRRRP